MATTKKFGNEKLTVNGDKPGKPEYDTYRKNMNQEKHGSVYKGYGRGEKGK